MIPEPSSSKLDTSGTAALPPWAAGANVSLLPAPAISRGGAMCSAVRKPVPNSSSAARGVSSPAPEGDETGRGVTDSGVAVREVYAQASGPRDVAGDMAGDMAGDVALTVIVTVVWLSMRNVTLVFGAAPLVSTLNTAGPAVSGTSRATAFGPHTALGPAAAIPEAAAADGAGAAGTGAGGLGFAAATANRRGRHARAGPVRVHGPAAPGMQDGCPMAQGSPRDGAPVRGKAGRLKEADGAGTPIGQYAASPLTVTAWAEAIRRAAPNTHTRSHRELTALSLSSACFVQGASGHEIVKIRLIYLTRAKARKTESAGSGSV